ncbi:hypothetical protein [Nitrosopumilus sp. Nsub]|uniref:hypothetical protein n=1 Tax=Nitrosopumilus sp. Nsub TaxID=1776294 RepID=UPI00082CFA00|nr:hypothetical protein [Nitrosopumilus sp. Nsub]
MTWKTSLLILFATVMVAFVPLSAYAGVDDGNLRKITSDGQYDIGMSWQPAGPLQPGIDYLFNFEIREGMSQKNIDDASFSLDVVKDGTVVDTASSSGTLTKTISFEKPGLVNLLLTDVNSSPQQVDFTFPVGNEKSSKNGISYAMKNYNAEPKIFFCGSAKDLETCLKKEVKGDVGWFGKVTVMIYAPGWNIDDNARDSIGHTSESPLKIYARGDGTNNQELSYCNDSNSEGLIETAVNSGVFYGRLKLSGMDHDMNNDGVVDTKLGGTSCKNSPFDEYAKIETGRDGAVTVNWEYNPENNKVVTKTMTYSWNVATIEFLEDEYPINSMVEFKLKEKDLGDMPKDKIDLNFRVWSDSDMSGILIDATQDSNWKHKKPYHFNIQDSEESNGDNLYAQEGDTLYVEYVDTTLPTIGPNGEKWSKSDTLDIIATTATTSGYPYITLR